MVHGTTDGATIVHNYVNVQCNKEKNFCNDRKGTILGIGLLH